MTGHDPSISSEIDTAVLRVPGANCPWCFNTTVDRLREVQGVVEVRASILGGCIEIRHVGASTSALLSTVRSGLHGADDSSHECQMVVVEPELVSEEFRGGTSPEVTRDMPEPGIDRSMETLVEAMRRLRSLGYTHDFIASSDGGLVCRSCGSGQSPESIEVRETVRFEGDSNPDDEAILFALSCADGRLGQYSAAFGPGTAPADVQAFERLRPTRR